MLMVRTASLEQVKVIIVEGRKRRGASLPAALQIICIRVVRVFRGLYCLAVHSQTKKPALASGL
jgi:hypothetical protein